MTIVELDLIDANYADSIKEVLVDLTSKCHVDVFYAFFYCATKVDTACVYNRISYSLPYYEQTILTFSFIIDQYTVPNIFIEAIHVGGNDDLQESVERGEVQHLIRNVIEERLMDAEYL